MELDEDFNRPMARCMLTFSCTLQSSDVKHAFEAQLPVFSVKVSQRLAFHFQCIDNMYFWHQAGISNPGLGCQSGKGQDWREHVWAVTEKVIGHVLAAQFLILVTVLNITISIFIWPLLQNLKFVLIWGENVCLITIMNTAPGIMSLPFYLHNHLFFPP